MDPHAEPVQEEFRMDYSEWHPVNFIPLVIVGGFIITAISIFVGN